MGKVNLYARQCSVTGRGMNDGWCFESGALYAKTQADADAICQVKYGYPCFAAFYDEDLDSYYTEWEIEDADVRCVEIEEDDGSCRTFLNTDGWGDTLIDTTTQRLLLQVVQADRIVFERAITPGFDVDTFLRRGLKVEHATWDDSRGPDDIRFLAFNDEGWDAALKEPKDIDDAVATWQVRIFNK